MVTFSYDTMNLPPPNTIISTAASLAATAVLIGTLATDFIPQPIQQFFSTQFTNLSKSLSSQLTVVVDEFNGLTPNHMFEASNVYLGTKISPLTRRIKANKSNKENYVSFCIDVAEEIVDYFEGVKISWILNSGLKQSVEGGFNKKKKRDSGSGLEKNEMRYFEIKFHKKYKDLVLSRYLRHVLIEAKNIKQSSKEIKLHTVDYNGTDYWSCINLDHPATFDKIAMDPELKKGLIEDLDRFISRREYYRRVGKAWKRGYLLYGPPGTGKSSLVAAMANYLKFDVYDLDLREVMCNSDLRRLLIGTASKSILVIEDIDCSIDLQNRDATEDGAKAAEDEKVSLSALLNFIDGLWSTCGDERIIVFTTNHKDRLDPALLRPGRMDVQIYMSYCTFSGFKLLAANYLEIHDHPLFDDIMKLLDNVNVTPAEVAGELMKSDDSLSVLERLVSFLTVRSEIQVL
ncbi:AAA-ATPase At3g50940-like [Amaranthus tricolor]|uniref:AAA-ATPase At3g50940-like n=1 Tax=Amaranthus tricolor TaxID=29722 RepID=UPI00258A5328|nr:AAA-ATPase At3g50940-like [Amaranthus tricolor]